MSGRTALALATDGELTAEARAIATLGLWSDQRTSEVVNASGGAVVITDACIVVPPNSLSTVTSITVVDEGAVPDAPQGVTPISSLYSFAPTGLQFSSSVMVTIPTTIADAHFFYSTASGYEIRSAIFTGNLLFTEIPHFSRAFIGTGTPSVSSSVSSSTYGGGVPEPPYDPAYYIDGEIVYESELRAQLQQVLDEWINEIALVDAPSLEVVVESSSMATRVEALDVAAGGDVGQVDAAAEILETSASSDPGDDPVDLDPST